MLSQEIQQIKNRFGIIGMSSGLNRAIDKAVQVAPTDLSILIQGESGVGKEVMPQIVHQFSPRKHNTYIAVNCGAIPEGTIDSELFGHEKGSFTSASSDRKGYFEEANGGTIFLDEVGELPLATQVRLLRVLESGEYMRVGSSKVRKTDVRVVAATNVNMLQSIQDGKFREDLYYRLNAVPVFMPALRERKEDIPLLFRKFANDFAEKYRMPVVSLTEEAMGVLVNYYWRGNIRQLRNIVEQISVIEERRTVSEETIRRYLPEQENRNLPAVVSGSMGQGAENRTFNNEREILYQVLFDLQKDMTEMKKIVHNIVSGGAAGDHPKGWDLRAQKIDDSEWEANVIEDTVHSEATEAEDGADDGVVDVGGDENLSLVEMERQMIVKALARHNGRRGAAAEDLGISERSLYRKIKGTSNNSPNK